MYDPKLGHFFQPLSSISFSFLCINKIREKHYIFIRFIFIGEIQGCDNKRIFKEPTDKEDINTGRISVIFNESIEEIRTRGMNIRSIINPIIITNFNVE